MTTELAMSQHGHDGKTAAKSGEMKTHTRSRDRCVTLPSNTHLSLESDSSSEAARKMLEKSSRDFTEALMYFFPYK